MSSQTVDDGMNEAGAPSGKPERSARGPFEIFEAATLTQPTPRGAVTPEQVAGFLEHGALAEKFGEKESAAKLFDLIEATTTGAATTVQFQQKGPNGFILAHQWFGPNFDLFRHSHPAIGDCLYYVIAGEILLGKKRLGPGSGFFVPNGTPYKYKAGPTGVEVLEIRAGGGTPGAPVIQVEEHSLEAIDKLIETARDNEHLWTNPPQRVGDTPNPTE